MLRKSRKNRLTTDSARAVGVSTARAGFTLIEMLVVLGILGLLFSVTVPFVVSFIRPREAERAANTILMTALRARSLAIEARKNIDLVLDEKEGRLWLRKTATAPDIRTFEVAVVDEPMTLYPPARLLLGKFGDPAQELDMSGNPREKPGVRFVTFTPSGGLNGGTLLDGFHFIGVSATEGKVQSATSNSLTAAGAPWEPKDTDKPNSPDNPPWYENFCVAITKSATVKGQVRVIESNTGNALTLKQVMKDGVLQDAFKDAKPDIRDEFVIVAPNDVRKIVIYSTTGKAVASAP